METTLDRVHPGMEATVAHISAEEPLRRRLADFGLVPGTAVQCRYRSPGGDVTAIALRGSVIALRTRDLAKIAVRL